jgi:HPt (histidine-containing phosphotransfer) domain-containing protein
MVDGWLPGLVEVVTALRKQERMVDRRLAILVMADLGEDETERCRAVGADAVIGKPLNVDEFTHKMASLQAGNGTQRIPASGAKKVATVIRWDEALEAVGGRHELLAELIEIFMEEYPPTLDAIRAAIDQHDSKGLQLSAHKLKGCLRYFGRSEAAECAKSLEDRGREGRWEGTVPALERLTSALTSMLPHLQAGPGKA